MLVHLTYWSKASKHLEADEINQLRDQAAIHNEKNAITGCLLLINGFFVQTIEGHSNAINGLYSKIMHDIRHHDLILLQYNQIIKRSFFDWMFVSRIDEAVYSDILLAYSSQIPFSFDDVTAPAIDHLINEMYFAAKQKP